MKQDRASSFARVVLDHNPDEQVLKIQLDTRPSMEAVAKALEVEGCKVERDRIRMLLTVTRPASP